MPDKMTMPKPNEKPMSQEAMPLHKQVAMGKNPQTGCGTGDKDRK